MKNGKSADFTCFLRDCRCSGRQTVGNGSPFNPVFLAYLPLRRPKILTVSKFLFSCLIIGHSHLGRWLSVTVCLKNHGDNLFTKLPCLPLYLCTVMARRKFPGGLEAEQRVSRALTV